MKQHISSISTKVSRAIYVIKRAKHFLPQNALKTLYTSIVQNHLQYGRIAWGNGTNVIQSHTDPLFKQNILLKINDIFKLQTTLFMHDYVHNIDKLPKSFNNFIGNIPTNKATRHFDLPRLKALTQFSDNLTKLSWPCIWNNLDNTYKEWANIL